MSARRELERRLHGLREIQAILGSMKTLALIETRKLARFIETQRRVLSSIERAAADFCRHFPHTVERPPALREAYLLLGSERGFCGDLNERLLAVLARETGARPAHDPIVLVVGSRLVPKLEDDPRVIARLAGASVAEEVPSVLSQVLEEVVALQARLSPLALSVLHHDPEAQQVQVRRLLPPFEILIGGGPASGCPPQLNLPAGQLCAELIDHYLFAGLHQIFYAALMVENQRRVEHLEGAVRRLEEELRGLELKRNALRQEEITEEIEVILLSVQAEGDY